MAQKAIASDPKDAASHYIIAQNAMDNKDYNTALKEMKAAVEYDPNNYLYWYNLGKIQYTLTKYSEAASSFTKSCDLKNDFAPSRYNLGLTQKKLKNDTAALAAFRKTIDIDSRHEKAYLEEARILADRSDYTGAIDAYKSVLKINNINVQAAMELGNVYYLKKNYADAEDSYKRALTMLSPSENMTLTKYNLSTVLYDEGKLAEAQKYAWQAYDEKDFMKNEKLKVNVVYNYALILDRSGKSADAEKLYSEVLEMNPNHVKAKVNLSAIYMSGDNPDLDKVILMLTEAGNIEQNSFEVYNNLGSAYLLKNDYDKAIESFKKAAQILPDDKDALSNLANAYAKNQEYENARDTFEKLLKKDKSNWAAYISLAKVYIQLDQNATAREKLLYLKNNNPDYRKAEVDSLLAVLAN